MVPDFDVHVSREFVDCYVGETRIGFERQYPALRRYRVCDEGGVVDMLKRRMPVMMGLFRCLSDIAWGDFRWAWISRARIDINHKAGSTPCREPRQRIRNE